MQPAAAGFPAPEKQLFPPNSHYQPPLGQWSTGLCACFDDLPICLTTYICPCITFGRNAEIIDKGASSCCGSGVLYGLLCCLTAVTGGICYCNWLYSCTYRSKIKQQYGIPAGCCEDCCVHFCCEFCAVCQESRELQNRGYNLSVGI
ncbi:hypothetical protein Nepgr_017613 [Nepenthes gracilis]|uniref:Uncharacterized protein n=1 Tax=Nepenthes gracilis TaxID=150966 RepID=A0AAD3SRF7_NEPGR|nr:hypothetical protein Nepgr_017613 [Nepenthes gracilis]